MSDWYGRKAPDTPIFIAVRNMPAPPNGSGNGGGKVWLEAIIWLLILGVVGAMVYIAVR